MYVFPDYTVKNFWQVSGGLGRVCRVGGKGSGGHNKLSKAQKAKALAELKKGKGVLEVAASTGMGSTSVARIRHTHKLDLPSWKSKTVAALAELHGKVVADLQENYKAVPPGQKSILLGIITDKIRILAEPDGQAVTHNHLHISHGDLNSLLTDNKTGNNQQNKRDSETFDNPLDTPAPGPPPIDVESKDTNNLEESRGGGG